VFESNTNTIQSAVPDNDKLICAYSHLIFDEGRLFQKEDGAFVYNFDTNLQQYIHLLTGYEGNRTLIVPKVPTIF
jgi:hypothetical protein